MKINKNKKIIGWRVLVFVILPILISGITACFEYKSYKNSKEALKNSKEALIIAKQELNESITSNIISNQSLQIAEKSSTQESIQMRINTYRSIFEKCEFPKEVSESTKEKVDKAEEYLAKNNIEEANRILDSIEKPCSKDIIKPTKPEVSASVSNLLLLVVIMSVVVFSIIFYLTIRKEIKKQ